MLQLGEARKVDCGKVGVRKGDGMNESLNETLFYLGSGDIG